MVGDDTASGFRTPVTMQSYSIKMLRVRTSIIIGCSVFKY